MDTPTVLTITAAAVAAPSVALSGGDAQWNGYAMEARARMTLSGVRPDRR
ncbi:hypothetical protein SAMN05444398_12319 [Roseovarius pacificus]|uniref:Uncharacterized protein n=1 Tax=Roseovarius pacificus TaxID=337701 RepID=A0A1M7JXY9_9RHOB|nr:hypothetical protein [Roseovarius pacificus]GGO62372.1 hypothetical protein GCM10011315_41200 [Roseovarius pacificus]SHM57920.1 hypothetical protein SAMN05444398_12319 [Roseovarius pacificus]